MSDRFVVAFHGFVGNWEELKVPPRFNCNGDLECADMVAGLYALEGNRVFERLRGEFAIIVHDRVEKTVVGVRDVVGCRPLYFQRSGGRIVLASEIRQVLAGTCEPRIPNDRAIAAYLAGLPLEDDETPFDGVRCVLPGSVYRISGLHSGKPNLRVDRYWDVLCERGLELSESEYVEEISFRLKRAVRRCLPHRPSAIALSGGLDSSTAWGHAVRLAREGHVGAERARPLSLVFPGLPCDETEYIQTILASTGEKMWAVDATSYTADNTRQALLEITDAILFPTTYHALIAAQTAAGDNRYVVLTGMLGDQWFALSSPTRASRLRGSARRVLDRSLGESTAVVAYGLLKRAIRRESPNEQDAWFGRSVQSSVRRRRWKSSLDTWSPGSQISRRLERERTGNLFQSNDQIGAAYGVEFRNPFADADVMSLAAVMPSSLCNGLPYKVVLRKAYPAKDLKTIAWRRDKTVFNCLDMVREPRMLAKKRLDKCRLVSRGIIDRAALDSMVGSIDTDEEAKLNVLLLEEAEWFLATFDEQSEHSCAGSTDES